MACQKNETLYNCEAKVLFQAAVHILRRNIEQAKKVFAGDCRNYGSVAELLGLGDPNTTILQWFEGNNTFVPDNPDWFFERIFLERNFTDPEVLSVMGFLEQAGIKCHNGFVNDGPSPGFEDRLRKFNEYSRRVLNTDDMWPDLTDTQRVSCNVLRWTVENSIRPEYRDMMFPVHQFGFIAMYLFAMTDQAVVQDLEDVQRYVSRVISGASKYQRICVDIKAKQSRGIMAPKHCLIKSANALKTIVDDLQCDNNKMVSAVKSKYRDSVGEDLPSKSEQEVMDAIRSHLIPSIQECLKSIEGCIEVSSENIGLWQFKNGDKYYQQILKWHTTISLTPQEVHELGEKYLKSIQNKVVKLVESLNEKGDMTLSSSDSLSTMLSELRGNKKFRFQSTPEGRAECVELCKGLLHDISKRVAPLFNHTPTTACEVSEVPQALSRGGALAYYQEGNLDGTRPGVFYINTYNMGALLRPLMKSLTAHEAVPGHHYQFALQLENPDLPVFRKRCNYMLTGFKEGWGLYTEHLADEIGFYKDETGDDSYDTLGYYVFELLRSARLVVDTGIHAFKWTRDKAIEYMVENTGFNRSAVEAEVDRYCVAPGQACAYKIGQVKILETRAKLAERDGFDLAAFHSKLLSMGAVPLEVMEQEMLNDTAF